MVLDSDKENEVKRLIYVQGPNTQTECAVEVSNANNEETKDLNSGRGIRDGPLRLNINIPEDFDEFQDFSVNTPSYADQMENVGSPPMNSNLVNCNESEESRVILVHSLDTSYTPSNTPIILNKSIPNDNNSILIDNERARVQTRSRIRNNDILNSGVRTRSMVAESSRGLFTPASMRNTVSNITDSVRRGLN